MSPAASPSGSLPWADEYKAALGLLAGMHDAAGRLTLQPPPTCRLSSERAWWDSQGDGEVAQIHGLGVTHIAALHQTISEHLLCLGSAVSDQLLLPVATNARTVVEAGTHLWLLSQTKLNRYDRIGHFMALLLDTVRRDAFADQPRHSDGTPDGVADMGFFKQLAGQFESTGLVSLREGRTPALVVRRTGHEARLSPNMTQSHHQLMQAGSLDGQYQRLSAYIHTDALAFSKAAAITQTQDERQRFRIAGHAALVAAATSLVAGWESLRIIGATHLIEVAEEALDALSKVTDRVVGELSA